MCLLEIATSTTMNGLSHHITHTHVYKRFLKSFFPQQDYENGRSCAIIHHNANRVYERKAMAARSSLHRHELRLQYYSIWYKNKKGLGQHHHENVQKVLLHTAPFMECKYCTGKTQGYVRTLHVLLSNVTFNLFFSFTTVCLLHLLAVHTDFTDIHATV